MTDITILFETIAAAEKAFAILQPMSDIIIDCNAITYNQEDEELVEWLIQDSYCRAFSCEKVYLYPINIIKKSSAGIVYQYGDLLIEQTFIPPADWEFITKNSRGEIVDKTSWSYEDGLINIGFYIEKFLISQS